MVLIAPTYAHILIAQRYPYSSTVRSLQQGHFSSAAAGPGPCRLDAVEPAGARAPFDQHAFGAFAVRTSRYSPVVQVRTGPYRPVAREYPYMQATHRASPAQSPRQAAARCSPPGLPVPGLCGDCSSGLQHALAPKAHCEALVRASGRSRTGGWTAQCRYCVAAWWATRGCPFVARPSPNLFHSSSALSCSSSIFFLSLLRRST